MENKLRFCYSIKKNIFLESDNEELVLQYESEELMSLIANLKDCIVQEKCEISRLHTKLTSFGKIINVR